MINRAYSAAVAVSTVALLGATAAAPKAEASWLTNLLGNASGQTRPVATSKTPAATPVAAAADGSNFHDGSFTGPTVDAYYGLVQVKANINGGQLVSVDVLQYPKDRRTSRSINSQALPMLESEVITSQNANVDIVSGATLTSEAFLRSLNAALVQAGNGA